MDDNSDEDGVELRISNLSKENEKQNNILEEFDAEKDDDQYEIQRNLDKDSVYDLSIKVILLGDSMVGKSSIIFRLCKEMFDQNIGCTISIEYYNYIIKINDYTVRMQIWDTAGQEKFNSIIKNYYQNTDFAIYVYSIDNLNSFQRIKLWMSYAEEINGKSDNHEVKNILLGNKRDLDSTERKVSYDEGNDFSKNNNMIFREISCKDESEDEINNLLEVFDEIAKCCYINRRRTSTFGSDRNDSLSYVASKSMMEMMEYSQRGKKKNKNKAKKKMCC